MVKEQIEQETICHILERRTLKLNQWKTGVRKLLLLMFRVLLERHVTMCWGTTHCSVVDVCEVSHVHTRKLGSH